MRSRHYGFVILLLNVLLVLKALSQDQCNLTFSGVVNDSAGPLPGAAVILLPQQLGVETDSLGRFEFRNLCSKDYNFVVRYPSHRTFRGTIKLVADLRRTLVLQDSSEELNEVIIQGQTINTDHSQNYTQLDEKQLGEAAGKSLGETLKEIPGVNTIQSGPGIFKPVIHGVHSQRILILNDGIRQEGQQWGAEHAPEIDPFIASNIVVIKDASSIKYGTDAIGGVIVVNPPALPERAGMAGTINTVGQSNGRSGILSGLLEGGIKNANGWGWRIQGTGKKSGDYHTPTYSLTNTGVEEMNYSAATGYHSERLGVEAFFSHFQSSIGILKGTAINNQQDLDAAMERSIPAYTTSFSYNISEPRQQVSHNLFKLNGHAKVKGGELRLQYGLQRNHRQEFDLRIGSLSKKPALDLVLTTHTLEAELEKSIAQKRTLCMGLTGMFQQNSTVFGTSRIPFIPNFDNLSTGVYSVAKFFSASWTFDIGARYDLRYYSINGYDFKNSLFQSTMMFHNLSFTSGATLLLNHDQQINVNISSTWRPPSVAELYSVGTHQSAAANEYGLLLDAQTNEVHGIRDVDFHNEQAVKFVGTYSKRWSKFQVEMSPYLNYIFNYIYLRPSGVSQTIRATLPYFRYTQTNALFLGADFSGAWSAAKYVTLTPKVSLIRVSDVTHHDYLVYIPSNRYEVAARFEKPKVGRLGKLYVESKIKYVSRQGRAPRVVTTSEINEAVIQKRNIFEDDPRNFDFMQAPAGYLLVGAATGFVLQGQKTQYDFRLACENATNARYREYTNRFRYYADDIGRNFILSVKCIF